MDRADATGMVPASLAREKGHRFLAHYLEEYPNRHGSKQRFVSRHACTLPYSCDLSLSCFKSL